jgi:hypothetical protein
MSFTIPRKKVSSGQRKVQLLSLIKERIKASPILQAAKDVKSRNDSDGRHHHGSDFSFIHHHLTGEYNLYDRDGHRIHEPRAPDDVPILPQDFKRDQSDHDARWWGVRLTEHDDDDQHSIKRSKK